MSDKVAAGTPVGTSVGAIGTVGAATGAATGGAGGQLAIGWELPVRAMVKAGTRPRRPHHRAEPWGGGAYGLASAPARLA